MAKAPKHKQPTFNEHVAALKEAKVATDPDDYLDMRPAWRVGMLQMAPPYGWHILTVEEATSIQDRLKSFESMTWREILFASQDQNHSLAVDQLSKECQDRLTDVAPDIDELMSLRISSSERIFGIMDGQVCQVLFWDPEHTIYKMNIADN